MINHLIVVLIVVVSHLPIFTYQPPPIQRGGGYRIAGPKSFASIACKISYISRNSICSDGGISNPDSYKSIHSPVITTWGGGSTRIKVSANSNCPCRIKCIAIVVLTSTSFPSNTSALITVEGSLLNFCSPPPHQSPVSDKD